MADEPNERRIQVFLGAGVQTSDVPSFQMRYYPEGQPSSANEKGSFSPYLGGGRIYWHLNDTDSGDGDRIVVIVYNDDSSSPFYGQAQQQIIMFDPGVHDYVMNFGPWSINPSPVNPGSVYVDLSGGYNIPPSASSSNSILSSSSSAQPALIKYTILALIIGFSIIIIAIVLNRRKR